MKTTPTILAAVAAFLLADPSASFAQSSGKLSFGKPKAKAAESAALVTVQAKGQGETVEAAKKDAARNAIKKAVGELVDARTLVENDELVEDRILTLSNAMIEKADYGDARNIGDGLFEVPVTAVVKKGRLNQELKAIGITTGDLAGDSLSAAMFTGKERLANAERFFAERFDGFPQNVVEGVLLTKEDGTPAVVVNPQNGHLYADVGVSVNMNHFTTFAQSLAELLATLCKTKENAVLSFTDVQHSYIAERHEPGKDTTVSIKKPGKDGYPFLLATPKDARRSSWPASIYYLDEAIFKALMRVVDEKLRSQSLRVEILLNDSDGTPVCSKSIEFGKRGGSHDPRERSINGWRLFEGDGLYFCLLPELGFESKCELASPIFRTGDTISFHRLRYPMKTIRFDLGEVSEDDLAEVAGFEVKVEYK